MRKGRTPRRLCCVWPPKAADSVALCTRDPIFWSADKFKLKTLENDFINFVLEKPMASGRNASNELWGGEKSSPLLRCGHAVRHVPTIGPNWYLCAGFHGLVCKSTSTCCWTPFSLAFWTVAPTWCWAAQLGSCRRGVIVQKVRCHQMDTINNGYRAQREVFWSWSSFAICILNVPMWRFWNYISVSKHEFL